MQISVIICTHNPRRDYLERTLNALQAQTLPREQWEFLLIDNASKEPVASQWDLSWQPHARHVLEPQLGLTHARLRGIKESNGELLVFVDDDNVLFPEYLAECLQIAFKWPILGAWGGQHFPEFEGGPPADQGIVGQWTSIFARDLWSNNYDPQVTPFGAGVCVRDKVALKYADLACNDPLRKSLDRKGSALTQAGDIDMAFVACDMGLGLGRFINLKLVHLIPKGRTTHEYLLRLSEGSGYSQVILDFLRGVKHQKTRRIDRLANCCKRFFLTPRERRVASAFEAGRTRAINELDGICPQKPE